MVEIPRCPNCDRVPNIHGEDGIYQRRCSCGVSGPVAADLSISDALWKEVICRVATTEPPAAGTVRVPVQISSGQYNCPSALANDGTVWQFDPNNEGWFQLARLPQPVEIPGTVEVSDGE